MEREREKARKRGREDTHSPNVILIFAIVQGGTTLTRMKNHVEEPLGAISVSSGGILHLSCCTSPTTFSLIVQVIDALSLNMEMKSRTYESPVLAALFLMNNFHFIKSSFVR